jgi:malate dehydrogenase (oxaloacetate-decarboxylating)
VIASGAKRVTDGMFLRAAEVLSKFAPILNNPYGSLFPRIKQLPVISKEIAIAVANVAIEEGISEHPPEDVEKAVDQAIWRPRYPKIKRKR